MIYTDFSSKVFQTRTFQIVSAKAWSCLNRMAKTLLRFAFSDDGRYSLT